MKYLDLSPLEGTVKIFKLCVSVPIFSDTDFLVILDYQVKIGYIYVFNTNYYNQKYFM